MRRLAAVAALTLVLSGLAAPAMAADPVPSRELSQLTDAPVDPSPSHHKIKAPPLGKSDWYLLTHGGFSGGAATATDTAAAVSVHTAPVLIKAGLTVAKVAKVKALKQPKQVKTTKPAASPKQATAKATAQPKTTKAAKVKAPALTPQQAFQQAFANPPRVRPKMHPAGY